MEMANPDKSIIDPSWQLSQIDPKLTLTGLAGSEAALYRSTAARPVSGDTTLDTSHRKPLNYHIYLQRQVFAHTAPSHPSHQKQLNVSTGYKIVCGFLHLMVF